MFEVTDNELIFSFPDVNESAVLRVHFGNAAAPDKIVPVVERPDKVGFLLATVGPVIMHLCPSFCTQGSGLRYPFAVLISVGGINAITGNASDGLLRNPQNYFTTPPQGGIDGYFADNQVHPFRVSADLRLNRTPFEIKVFPMKKETWSYLMHRRTLLGSPWPLKSSNFALLHGGERECEPIYEDGCCFGDWDQGHREEATVWLKGPR